MSTSWVGGYLPAAFQGQASWHSLSFGDSLEVRVPTLDAAAMRRLAAHVREAGREHLAPLPVSRVIAILDAAVARLLDPEDPVRREADALLPRVSGLDADMVRLALGSYLKTFRAPQLHRFVAEDFPNPKVLDEFQPAVKGGAVRAMGPSLLAHGWSGNVPGLPLWSLACGLLVKAPAIGKLPSAEPVFASLFARLLAQAHPPLADCLAVLWWRGGEAEPARTLYAEADTVLAYGGNTALAEVRTLVPVGTRFIGFGHKLGLALVGRRALDACHGPATARLAAHDVARHDQQGCYSPHVIYVERGGRLSPRAFAQHLAGELGNLERRFPRGPLAVEESAEVAGWRQGAELRGEATDLIADEGGAWAVAYSDGWRPLAPSPGRRCVEVVAVDALEQSIDPLAPHAAVLQTVGLAVEPARLHALAERLAGVGVTRICALGAMTAPEAGWHHDGRFNLADLVRMVEIEASAERAAEAFAPYAQEELP